MGETGSNCSGPSFFTGFGTAPMMDALNGYEDGNWSSSRINSMELAVAGSTGSFRTGEVITKLTACPEDVRAGTPENEPGGRKKGAISGGKVNGGIRRGG